MKRVFLYVRVSTEEQAIHGLSIDAQTAALQEWAKANHHTVVGVYTDAGISARKPASKRPALQKLLGDVRQGKGELIAFTKLDRWFRNIAEYYKVQEVLEQYHVDWRTIHEDYDTSNASGRLKINIMLSVAQDEADRTSERIKATMEVKRQRLEPLSGSCPTGYRQENKKYIKDPATQEAVAAFFQTYLESGFVAVAQRKTAGMGVWITNQVAYKMLECTCYYGKYYDVDGMTPPYITKEEYDKIQSMRKRRVRKTVRDRIYIFSGLISCGECGLRMSGKVNQNGKSLFYNCGGRYTKANQCENSVNLCERKIEEYLLSAIGGRMKKLRIEVNKINAAKKCRDYKAEISAARQKVKKLKDLYLNDLITLEEYKADFEAYTQKIAQLEEEAATEGKTDISALEKELSSGWKNLYKKSDRAAQQAFWRRIIKEIRIYKGMV